MPSQATVPLTRDRSDGSHVTKNKRQKETSALTSPRGILEQGDVDGAGGQVDVADDGAADEDVLDGAEVGVAQLLVDRDVVELDVEVLVHRLERARHLDVVLELDGDGLVDEGLEEACGFFPSVRELQILDLWFGKII